jgi:tetratricopeptide (TPR) repeat protein
MKRTMMILALCLSFGTIFAQSAVDLKKAGDAALDAKDFKKALENYDKALAAWGNQPQNNIMINNAAACAYKLKEYPKAIKYFDLLIKANVQTEDTYFYKANSCKMIKKDEECVKTYTEGLAKFPESAKLKDGLCKYYRGEGKIHYINGTKIFKAATDKVNAQKLKPTDPAYLAEAAKAKKEFTAAVELIDKALSINPSDADSKTVKAACEQNLKALPE